MKLHLKIFHWIILLWFLIALFNYDLIIDYLSLLISYIGLIVSDIDAAFAVLNFNLVDAFISTLLFLIAIPVVIIKKKKLFYLDGRLTFSFTVLITLCFIFLFAPIISNENPEFSKDLSVTKLLSPFSIVKQIKVNSDEEISTSEIELFKRKMNEIIKPSFDDNIIFADSVNLSQIIIYYQKDIAKKLDKEVLTTEFGIPLIKNRIFILGTDEYGRDLFARIIYGTRVSLTVGLGAVILSLLIGIILGFIAGYRGGLPDILLNRFTEIFLAFPVIYLVVLILALFGSSIFSVIIVLGISGWMSLFKIVKSEVVSIKQKDFFSTAELVGLSKTQLLTKEILPVMIVPVIVNLVFLFSNAVLAEAALSYLGLGTGNNYPSWGSMISSGQQYITKAWWLIAFPGLGLILTLFSINSSGRIVGKKLNPSLKN